MVQSSCSRSIANQLGLHHSAVRSCVQLLNDGCTGVLLTPLRLFATFATQIDCLFLRLFAFATHTDCLLQCLITFATQTDSLLCMLCTAVPFICRYRKEQSGSLEPADVRKIQSSLQQCEAVSTRRAAILSSLKKEGNLESIDNYTASHTGKSSLAQLILQRLTRLVCFVLNLGAHVCRQADSRAENSAWSCRDSSSAGRLVLAVQGSALHSGRNSTCTRIWYALLDYSCDITLALLCL
jgi:Tex-like protein N-terminal domain